VVRSLAEGPEAFWATLEAMPDFDGGAFAAFATENLLHCWLLPVLGDDRARHVFPQRFLADAAARQALSWLRDHGLAAASKDVAAAFSTAGVECLFLKGLLFAERFYDDPARRHQVDVDVLVPPSQLDTALEALGGAGFDVTLDLESGQPMSERLQHIREPGRRRVPHAVGVGRDGVAVDLHWCLRSRGLSSWMERGLWAARVPSSVAGTPVQTASDEHTLTFLLLSICGDVLRGVCRAKHFLDLYLMLRAVERDVDWEVFFESRARENLLRLCVNVLAVFIIVWDCRSEFPQLAGALERRRHLVELRDEEEAVTLLERIPGNAENRVWRRRVHPRSRWRGLASRLTVDMPRTLSRLRPSRRFSGRLAPL
jgi:hypothetical protein